MDKTALVINPGPFIAAAGKYVLAIKATQLDVADAFLAEWQGDESDFRLYLVIPSLRTEGSLKVYQKLRAVFNKGELAPLTFDDVKAVTSDDYSVKLTASGLGRVPVPASVASHEN
jgi:hypothetical protein